MRDSPIDHEQPPGGGGTPSPPSAAHGAGDRLAGLMAPFPFRTADEGPLPEVELVVLVDGSDPGRMGDLSQGWFGERPAPDLLVVDHHLHDGDPTWDFAYRDPRAAATAAWC